MLGAITLTYALALLIRTRRTAALRSRGFNVPVILLVWLGFSTPVDRWFGFAPGGVTTIAAWTVYALLALLPLVLVAIWLIQIGLSPLGLPSIGNELGASALLVIGLEAQGWLGDLVAILEAVNSVVIFLALWIAAATIIHNGSGRRAPAPISSTSPAFYAVRSSCWPPKTRRRVSAISPSIAARSVGTTANHRCAVC